MIPGKISPDLLRRLVYPHLTTRPDVLVAAGIGQDSAVLDFGPHACIITCDPITGARRELGRLAVHVACNDVAATGAEPVALLLTLLLPPGSGEAELELIMREAGETAVALGVAIVGGHTEVTPRVTDIVAVVTAVGRAESGGYLHAGGARPGDALLVSKAAAIEGTAILAADLAGELAGRVAPEVLARARRFMDEVSVLSEGRAAVRAGATAMHDVTEGGVLTAVWELAEASGLGVELWADAVPVRQETTAICRALGVDPLRLIGSGALLVASGDPDRTLAALAGAGVPGTRIGTMRAAGRVVRRDGREEVLVPPARDELWRILEEVNGPA